MSAWKACNDHSVARSSRDPYAGGLSFDIELIRYREV